MSIHLLSKITLESLKARLRARSIIYSTRNILLGNTNSSFSNKIPRTIVSW